MAANRARRTAGKVGCGGGPLTVGRGFFSVRRMGQTPVLQEREGDHAQQRVVVEASPRAALIVIEPELFFHLLMGLLADPAGLDRSR